ncbi:hypothetical protein [Paraburkholderia hospita]|jgi:hypothetical protein|uniref:hypothetical protein n=1 Tax=Paraburkholderia hospita TaxID=169430 RepID=UPI00115F8B3A|nr:hypothetical protein [Paraburkholderia hospita]
MKLLLCFVGLNCKVLRHLARFRMLKVPSSTFADAEFYCLLISVARGINPRKNQKKPRRCSPSGAEAARLVTAAGSALVQNTMLRISVQALPVRSQRARDA